MGKLGQSILIYDLFMKSAFIKLFTHPLIFLKELILIAHAFKSQQLQFLGCEEVYYK